MSTAFEMMTPDEDGWSDWIHPLPGYLMQCCDCGLVHELQVSITEAHDAVSVTNEGEDARHVVVFRMRRPPASRSPRTAAEYRAPSARRKDRADVVELISAAFDDAAASAWMSVTPPAAGVIVPPRKWTALRLAIAAGTRSAETGETPAPSEGCQSGGKAASPNTSSSTGE